MLKFSKGFNTNNNNVNTDKYNKLGRISPEEIIMKKYEYNNSLNKKEVKEEINMINRIKKYSNYTFFVKKMI